MIDGSRGLRRLEHADPEQGGVAEPEGEPGNKADLGDFDDAQAPGGVDAVAHGAAGEDARANIVSDRIAGEARERRDAIRHVGAADGAQREQIVEGERHIAGGDEEARNGEGPPVGRLERVEQRLDVEVAQDVIEHNHRHYNDGEAQREANAAEADVSLEEMHRRAQPLRHPVLQASSLLH